MNPTPDPEQTDPTPEPFDAELAALLADDADHARQAPPRLEAKVMALTDPAILSLLDEALAPAPAPHQLSDKIIAATLQGAAQQHIAPRGAVIGRIGPSTWRYAAAAAIVLAACAGLWWAGQQGDPANNDGMTVKPDTPQTPDLSEDYFALSTTPFDDEASEIEAAIEVVSERIDGYTTINRDTLWSDIDGYEQFVSTFELAG